MAGPVVAQIVLPLDSGNTGPKVRTQTKVVGGNTVHEHFFVQSTSAVVLGVYRAAMAQVTALAAAENGTSTGSLWFHVPTAISNKKARIRQINVTMQHSTALATPTAPRLALTRMTFTGTASGAAVTAIKLDATAPTPVADLRTAVTGLTVSLVGALATAPYGGALTAVGAYVTPMFAVMEGKSEDEYWTFAPGEGLVIWQDTAGTTSDTRKANFALLWDEIDTA